MNILMVASECFPYAKTGGMGEVVFFLSRSLKKLGHSISVVIPYYSLVEAYLKQENISPSLHTISVDFSGNQKKKNVKILFWKDRSGCIFYAVQHTLFFGRKEIYGDLRGDYPDNAKRFSFFCRSVLTLIKSLDKKFDIVHCHDWQTGLIPILMSVDTSFVSCVSKTKSLLTIHNLAYQGIFSIDNLTAISQNDIVKKALIFYEKINFLKAGLLFADALTTVSPRYSQELQTEPLGEGFSSLFQTRRDKFFGILNGIDTDHWNPMKKNAGTHPFDISSLENKNKNKRQIFKRFSWSNPEKCLFIGIFSRIVSYKGFDLIIEAFHDMMDLDIALVILGMGEDRIEKNLSVLAKRYSRLKTFFKYTDEYAHELYSSIDAFLMPSFFEPCGLTQMIAMRYGAVPLIHLTGGLMNTVGHWEDENSLGKGFIMHKYTPSDLVSQLRCMCEIYQKKDLWHSLVCHNMTRNFSWDLSSKKYSVLYQYLIGL